jgi:hypothetical protein
MDETDAYFEEEGWSYQDGEFEWLPNDYLMIGTTCIDNCFSEDDAFDGTFEDF